MDFNIEKDLDLAKGKAVQEATEKFGSRATPMAEKVADKTEEEVAGKLGVPLHNQPNQTNAQRPANEPNKRNEPQS